MSDSTGKIWRPVAPREAIVCLAFRALELSINAPHATLMLVCVYELMRAKGQANISVPPTRPGGRRAGGASPFKTPGGGNLKSVREGFSTE
jgi:hypothetical protein